MFVLLCAFLCVVLVVGCCVSLGVYGNGLLCFVACFLVCVLSVLVVVCCVFSWCVCLLCLLLFVVRVLGVCVK